MIGRHYTPVPPSTNGTHFRHVHGARDVLRDERWLDGHRHARISTRARTPLRDYLVGASALVLFWLGVALLLGWRPLPW